MTYEIASVIPIWRENYDSGYVGFSYCDNSFVSQGIAWFSRWDAWPIPIPISHTFIVTGPDTVVEAVGSGVKQNCLSDRFNDPHTHVFFRKPTPYNENVGVRLVTEANKHIGQKYGYGTIVADPLANSILGHLLNAMLFHLPDMVVSHILRSKDRPVCSVLVAEVLDALPEFKGRGVLAIKDLLCIKPQQLFEDQQIFAPWRAS